MTTSRPLPRTRRTLSSPSVRTSRNSISGVTRVKDTAGWANGTPRQRDRHMGTGPRHAACDANPNPPRATARCPTDAQGQRLPRPPNWEQEAARTLGLRGQTEESAKNSTSPPVPVWSPTRRRVLQLVVTSRLEAQEPPAGPLPHLPVSEGGAGALPRRTPS